MASRGDQIAERIRKHLRRFEADAEINRADPRYPTLRPYYSVGGWRAGRYIGVSYVLYQDDYYPTFDEAEAYADWLGAGNVGKHWEMEES